MVFTSAVSNSRSQPSVGVEVDKTLKFSLHVSNAAATKAFVTSVLTNCNYKNQLVEKNVFESLIRSATKLH